MWKILLRALLQNNNHPANCLKSIVENTVTSLTTKQ